MATLQIRAVILSTMLVLIIGVSQDTISTDLIFNKVQRTVDLTTHLPKIVSSITLENNGKSTIRSFLYAVEANLRDHVSFIGAIQMAEGEKGEKLTIVETSVADQKDKKFYKIELDVPLAAGKQTKVDVETAFSHTLRPYPSHIVQAEKQLVEFAGNMYLYSPYKVVTQSTVAKTTSSHIESFTKIKKVSTTDNTITYGPFENLEPFSQEDMLIHYENNSPFLTITSMTRLIEVSHWGNIAVEETYDLVHSGAVLKGSFSRYDYQRQQDGVSSVKSFKTVLPAAAKDVYYRDEIGNISTSNLKELEEAVELELRPRFPLFGGWKTHYYIGYNVPSYQYLFTTGDRYVLKMRFVDHIFDDQVIDDITVKVILPEGASNLELKTPFSVTRDPDELHYTYLDTIGRPVVLAKKSNLVEQHIQDFELHYTFPQLMLLQEPLLAVGAFYLMFMLVIVYVRMDFSITKDEATESRMRIAGLIEMVQASQDRRSALYQSYEDAINKYKASKDGNSFQANKKKVDSDHKQLSQQIATYLTKLKTESSDMADKVAELQRLDSQVKEQVGLAIAQSEKLISGKLNKQQYLDNEAAVNTKKVELLAKMEALMLSL